MLEIVIPFVLFNNINNIYTFGWDGPKNNCYINFDNKIIEIDNIKKNIKNTYNYYNEYYFIEYIKKMFYKNNINIFKCSMDSHINIEYKNIYKII